MWQLDGDNTFQFGPSDAPLFERVFLENERMFEQPISVGQVGDVLPPAVFFIASEEIFDTETCIVSFDSTLYAIGIVSGSPEFDLDTTQSGVETSDLGAGKAFGFSRDGNVYVTGSGGLGTSADVSVWGDGGFDDESAPAGFGAFTLQLQVQGFRISPF